MFSMIKSFLFGKQYWPCGDDFCLVTRARGTINPLGTLGNVFENLFLGSTHALLRECG